MGEQHLASVADVPLPDEDTPQGGAVAALRAWAALGGAHAGPDEIISALVADETAAWCATREDQGV